MPHAKILCIRIVPGTCEKHWIICQTHIKFSVFKNKAVLMLRSLHIKNFALAENLQIDFQPGLNILTGETGAGKSILVGAIAAVLGERVYTEVIRSGFEKAFVEGVFEVSAIPGMKELLEAKGLEASDELLLRREISLKSSSRAFINDSPVTVTTLAEIGNLLMDIHGQHEHQSLLRRETHGRFLDAFGRLAELLAGTAAAFAGVKAVEGELRTLEKRQADLTSKYDLYEFQYKEIADAELMPGEEETLEEERNLLANMEKVFAISTRLNELFGGEESNLLEGIAQAEQELRELARYAREMEKLLEEFATARIVFEETARSVEAFQSDLEFDPQRLETVEARLNRIAKLRKKYGLEVAELLNYQKELEVTLNLRENYQFEIDKLNRKLQQALEVYAAAARALSARRAEVATEMETMVQQQLNGLGMPNTRFQVLLTRNEDPQGIYRENETRYAGDANGIDQIEFYISPNAGEDFKPLSKIASGGEISRIMLSLKSILAEIDEVPTLVFDEIDAGISGRIAQAVGRSISGLSRSHQILCITHLPQIASHGEAHYAVEKFVEDGRTFTRIVPLAEDRRVLEVARLIAGDHISDTVLDSARQLIAEGKGKG